ncbi:hypothetical protein PDJAM_G00154330 [Pangasius djambal]|uniref:Uncharacterized protein n=1 Tax=Pangasius djambal TaxID=1691987 RepID=A0ACC5ZI85_9TELE|nr:hypothetical protein [Pangasius djambal]
MLSETRTSRSTALSDRGELLLGLEATHGVESEWINLQSRAESVSPSVWIIQCGRISRLIDKQEGWAVYRKSLIRWRRPSPQSPKSRS